MRRRLHPALLLSALLTLACGAPATTSESVDPSDRPSAVPDHGAGSGRGSADPACLVDDPFPSRIQNPAQLAAGRGEFRFTAREGNVLTAYTHRSATFDPRTGRIVFVIHGSGRNARRYLDAWRSDVERAGALATAPEFPDDLYPESEDFNLGVGVWSAAGSTSPRHRARPPPPTSRFAGSSMSFRTRGTRTAA